MEMFITLSLRATKRTGSKILWQKILWQENYGITSNKARLKTFILSAIMNY